MGAAFPRIARGNNNRRSQDRYLAFELIDDAEETIEAKLEKIGRFAHRRGEAKVSCRSYDPNEKLPGGFDRSAGGHGLAYYI